MDYSNVSGSVDSPDNLPMTAVDQDISSGRRRSGRIQKVPDYYANAFNDDTSTAQAVPVADGKLTSSGKVGQKKRKSTDSSATESAKEDKRSRLSDVSSSSIDSDLSSPATSSGMSTLESLEKAQLDTLPTGKAPSTKRRSTGAATAARGRTRATATGRRPKVAKNDDTYNDSSELAEATMTTVSAKQSEEPRPMPYGTPPVYADGRQSLCESLPYYRAYQSGAYYVDSQVWGMLLDRDSGERPYMDEEVVITRAGGGCKRNDDGEMVQVNSHTEDNAAIQSFMNNLRHRIPLVLIVGKDNSSCPVEIPRQYCIMAYFELTEKWQELSNGRVVTKFRFEKFDLDNKSWWAPVGSPILPPRAARVTGPLAARLTCSTCYQDSPQVFTQGWMCLNGSCSSFWMIGNATPPAKLTYNVKFLQERRPVPAERADPPFSLAPEPLREDRGNDPAYGFSRLSWKGFVCPKCHRCNSRKHWDAWRCEGDGCGFVHMIKQHIVSPEASFDKVYVQYDGHAVSIDDCDPSAVKMSSAIFGKWRISTYHLMEGNLVSHFHANRPLTEVEGGADSIFMDLQKDNCMGLERHKREQGTLKGENISGHFSKNFGLPYKYVTKTASVGFNEAPNAIIRALKRMTWAGDFTVGNGTFKRFNELLAVGYFEGQKMDYHDDGESTLGPTIATLSLGAPAIMQFRMKERYHKGLTKGNNYDPTEPVLRGCALESERLELNALHGTISDKEFNRRRELVYKNKPLKGPKAFLTMKLVHGDMVVMHGEKIQKYYEHTVKMIPDSKLRFGLTCRHVKTTGLTEDDISKGDYDPKLVDDYNGGKEVPAST